MARGADAGCGGRAGRRGRGPAPSGPGRSFSSESALCAAGGQRSGHAEGRGGLAAASCAPFKVSGRALPPGVAGTPSWAARSGAARQQATLQAPRPAAPRPAPPLAPVRLSARTRTHPRAVSTFSAVRSSERARAGRAAGAAWVPEAGPIPAAPPLPPQAPGSPRPARGLRADLCCWRRFRSALLKDERRHGRLCRFSRTVAAAAAAYCTFKWKIFRSQQKHCVQKD